MSILSNSQMTFETRIDVDSDAREAIAPLLNQELADLMDLRSQVKQAHWNVRGIHFMQLHKLFDDLAAKFDEPIDDVAERLGILGFPAEGTMRMATRNSRLADFNIEVVEGRALVEALVIRYASVAEYTREAISKASDAGDETTADLFTGISRMLDKGLWFLEAHLQG